MIMVDIQFGMELIHVAKEVNNPLGEKIGIIRKEAESRILLMEHKSPPLFSIFVYFLFLF